MGYFHPAGFEKGNRSCKKKLCEGKKGRKELLVTNRGSGSPQGEKKGEGNPLTREQKIGIEKKEGGVKREATAEQDLAFSMDIVHRTSDIIHLARDSPS